MPQIVSCGWNPELAEGSTRSHWMKTCPCSGQTWCSSGNEANICHSGFLSEAYGAGVEHLLSPIHQSRVFLQSAALSRFPALPDSRPVSTEAFDLNKPDGVTQTLAKKMKIYFRKYKLRAAGFKIYESVVDQIDYASFMTKLHLPDTFSSWFMITELHVWMLMARLMANPYEGRTIRNLIVEALWKDVTTRSKKLGTEHTSIIRKQIYELNEGFQAALVLYDEGLLSNDKVLASALWRRFYNRDCKSAHDLEFMVYYVRRSMYMLDSTELEDFVQGKQIKWIHPDKTIKELQNK